MSLDNMSDLLEEQLQDLYNAENQLAKALPKMAKTASNPKLKKAFEMHLEETKQHAELVKGVCEELDFKATGKVCKAMKGLIEEGKEVLEEDGEPDVIDAALIAAAQRIEHYEISAYGTVVAIAEALGHRNAVRTLKKIELQEGNTDKKLTAICESELLANATAGA
jgi:ferritin-like metal-binding protein YciE